MIFNSKDFHQLKFNLILKNLCELVISINYYFKDLNISYYPYFKLFLNQFLIFNYLKDQDFKYLIFFKKNYLYFRFNYMININLANF